MRSDQKVREVRRALFLPSSRPDPDCRHIDPAVAKDLSPKPLSAVDIVLAFLNSLASNLNRLSHGRFSGFGWRRSKDLLC